MPGFCFSVNAHRECWNRCWCLPLASPACVTPWREANCGILGLPHPVAAQRWCRAESSLPGRPPSGSPPAGGAFTLAENMEISDSGCVRVRHSQVSHVALSRKALGESGLLVAGGCVCEHRHGTSIPGALLRHGYLHTWPACTASQAINSILTAMKYAKLFNVKVESTPIDARQAACMPILNASRGPHGLPLAAQCPPSAPASEHNSICPPVSGACRPQLMHTALSRPPTHPPTPPGHRRLRIDTGWMPGLPVGSYFRFSNVTVSCTGNLTHPLPPGAWPAGGPAHGQQSVRLLVVGGQAMPRSAAPWLPATLSCTFPDPGMQLPPLHHTDRLKILLTTAQTLLMSRTRCCRSTRTCSSLWVLLWWSWQLACCGVSAPQVGAACSPARRRWGRGVRHAPQPVAGSAATAPAPALDPMHTPHHTSPLPCPCPRP